MSAYRELVHSIIDEINTLRTNPKEYAEKIEAEFQNYKENNVRYRPGTVPLQTREGLKAIEEVYIELQSMDPLHPLEICQGLTLAALDHCEDTGKLGIVGHIGSKEISLQKRIESYGKWSGNLIEALDYGSISAYEVVSSLLIDDGLETRPHRKALLNPNFKNIGVGASPHTEFRTMACVLFAANYTDNDDLRLPEFSNSPLPRNPEIDGWLEGATKVTCEIREETHDGVKVKRIKKHWQMADGTTRTTDEVVTSDSNKPEKDISPARKDIESKKEIEESGNKSSDESSEGKKLKRKNSDSSSSSG